MNKRIAIATATLAGVLVMGAAAFLVMAPKGLAETPPLAACRAPRVATLCLSYRPVVNF